MRQSAPSHAIRITLDMRKSLSQLGTNVRSLSRHADLALAVVKEASFSCRDHFVALLCILDLSVQACWMVRDRREKKRHGVGFCMRDEHNLRSRAKFAGLVLPDVAH